MKILFLTIADRIRGISARGVYSDLMRKFRNEGHDVYIVTPTERRNRENTQIINIDGITILRVWTLNITQINTIEKGVATLLIEYQFMKAIRKNLSDVHFDLILYSTPPVTFAKVIKYLKHRDKAVSYLLLKDIFPQNAVDIGMMKKGGFLYRHFRKKEKELYAISDYIGCMSPANVAFVLKHNPEIDPGKVEVNPNSIEPVDLSVDKKQISQIRTRYKIPANATVFIYGGNLGKPQGIDFLKEVLGSGNFGDDTFFVIVGSGTDYPVISQWYNKHKPENILLLQKLPKDEYDLFLRSCDVGLIFLDKRFTIPNFPSRLLPYLECRFPVIAATDENTDLGKIMQDNNFGLWSRSCDLEGISSNINKLSQNRDLRLEMGRNGYEYLLKNYTVSNSYSIICSHFPSCRQ